MHRLAIVLTWCGVLWAADRPWTEAYPDEAAAANAACKAKEYLACRQHLQVLETLLDGRADVIYKLAKVEAALGHTTAALEALTIFSRSGLTYAKPESEEEFAPLRDHEEFRAALRRIAASRAAVTASRPYLTLPENDLVAEDIAYDPPRRRFFVSSVRHRKILAIGNTGQTTDFLPEGQPDIWAILALAVDARRGCLWATTVAMPEAIGYDASQDGRSAVLRFSLASGRLLKRYDFPRDAKHAAGDMAVSPTGDVYVSDGNGPLYRIDHQRDELAVLIGPGTFHSPQTPAPAPSARLFVPDYARGISVVDLATRQTTMLSHPPELSLGGIDGLYLTGSKLLAIQNGTGPERLIRMQLDGGLTRVVRWETLEANWPGLGDPTHGVVVGSDFYFIANSGWDQLDEHGVLKQGGSFTPPVIRRMRLNAPVHRADENVRTH